MRDVRLAARLRGRELTGGPDRACRSRVDANATVSPASSTLRTIIELNPAEHVLRPMRELVLSGYHWDNIAIGFLVIAGLGLLGPVDDPQLPQRLQLTLACL